MEVTDEHKAAMIEVGHFLKRKGFDRFNTEALSQKLGYPVAGFERRRLRVVIGPRWTTVYEGAVAGGVMTDEQSIPTAFAEKIAEEIGCRMRGGA